MTLLPTPYAGKKLADITGGQQARMTSKPTPYAGKKFADIRGIGMANATMPSPQVLVLGFADHKVLRRLLSFGCTAESGGRYPRWKWPAWRMLTSQMDWLGLQTGQACYGPKCWPEVADIPQGIIALSSTRLSKLAWWLSRLSACSGRVHKLQIKETRAQRREKIDAKNHSSILYICIFIGIYAVELKTGPRFRRL